MSYLKKLIHVFLVTDADSGTKLLGNSSLKSSRSLEGMACGNIDFEAKVLEDGCTSSSKGITSLEFLFWDVYVSVILH